jgi:hypothetical protein
MSGGVDVVASRHGGGGVDGGVDKVIVRLSCGVVVMIIWQGQHGGNVVGVTWW